MTTSSCPGLGHNQEEDEGITMIGVGGVKVALGPLSCMCMGHPTTKLAHPPNRHFTKHPPHIDVDAFMKSVQEVTVAADNWVPREEHSISERESLISPPIASVLPTRLDTYVAPSSHSSMSELGVPVEVTTDSTSRTFSINAINFTLSSGEVQTLFL
ncbi:hypothetical protein GOBAR_AA24339 [Gossypium barbadense]|uniref:Uncharacterized protein n=1 Tax=Gossypium barbadense TaxID=3634 RepID=A0A2P5WZ03_GOSBA|nr:hypothetical protein GOBAR_AA24339 [Gossypium barbadense]